MRLDQRSRPFSGARLFAVPALCVATLTAVFAQEIVNLDVVHRIRQEALQNSRVMDHLFYLTDANGPRLTNSPGYFKAANWVVGEMKGWGIDARLESWGPFGRGWEFTHFSAHLIEPAPASLIGVPLAWTPGTNGAVTGTWPWRSSPTTPTSNAIAENSKTRSCSSARVVS